MINFQQFFDPYSYRSRLYPVFLVMLIPMLSLWLLLPCFSLQVLSLFSAISSFVGFFISLIVRDRGNSKQKELFHEWGGSPTTLMLMHSTTLLDSVTLTRYHTQLESNIPHLKFADKDYELIDRSKAVSICESAVKWLREATRDSKKHRLVFVENVNYGFKRNLFGLKPWGIGLCVCSFLFTFIYAYYVTSGNLSCIPVNIFSALILSFAGIWPWVMVVNTHFVKTAGFAYATALLAACDSTACIK